jgi:hypothetical protein
MNEQLISLNTARLAKEKGFNWDVFDYYYDGKLKRWSPSTRNANKFGVAFLSSSTVPPTEVAKKCPWMAY